MHRLALYAQAMVRFTMLASGSRGNSTIVCGGKTRILVDAGLSCRELFRRMRLAGEEPETLDAIVVTHEHSDHVGGLAVTARKLGIPVYFTEGTHRAWMRWLQPRKQMTYAQWLEQTRKQAAERQAEAGATTEEGEPDESDLVEAASELSVARRAGAKAPVDNAAFSARLKSCPDTKQGSPEAKSCPDTKQGSPEAKSCLDTKQGSPEAKSCPDTKQDSPEAGSCLDTKQDSPEAGSCLDTKQGFAATETVQKDP